MRSNKIKLPVTVFVFSPARQGGEVEATGGGAETTGRSLQVHRGRLCLHAGPRGGDERYKR